MKILKMLGEKVKPKREMFNFSENLAKLKLHRFLILVTVVLAYIAVMFYCIWGMLTMDLIVLVTSVLLIPPLAWGFAVFYIYDDEVSKRIQEVNLEVLE